MNFVQTLYFKNGINPFKHSFGWATPEHHIMGWTLSCLQLLKLYGKVDLYCNSEAASFLCDKIKLPYTNVFTNHDDFEPINDKLFALPKIFTYSLQKQPFIHVDGDVFIFKKLPNKLIAGNLIAQNIEGGTIHYNISAQKEFQRHLIYFPDCIKKEFNSGLSIEGVNAGILGGNDLAFIDEYSNLAMKYVNNNTAQLPLIDLHMFNMFFEQHLFCCLAKEKDITIDYLIEEEFKDQEYSRFGDFHEVPCFKHYLHLLGQYKRDLHTCRMMSSMLRREHPEFYYSVISICKKEITKLSISLYERPSLNTYNDYLNFDKSSVKEFKQASRGGIEKISLNNNINFCVNESIEKFEAIINNTLYSNNCLDEEINKDFTLFIQELRTSLEFCTPSETYIHGRDIDSINWFCNACTDELQNSKMMFVSSKGIKTLRTKYDWAGLYNKSLRVSVPYYELLQIEKGDFYNLFIPETFDPRFSLWDCEEIEILILEYLFQPLSIKNVFLKMYAYADEDVLNNHMADYQNLISAMIKQLILKKAILPVDGKN